VVFFPYFADIQMLCLLNSKERRKDQWEALLARAGLVAFNFIPLDETSSVNIIEIKKENE